MTCTNDDGDWLKKVFTDTEISKMQRAARAIIDTHQDDDPDVSDRNIQIVADISHHMAGIVMEWCRIQLEGGLVPPSVSEFLVGVGRTIGVGYLVDPDWEYDETLSDHATWFGATDWFQDEFMNDDGEDDEDDDDDT